MITSHKEAHTVISIPKWLEGLEGIVSRERKFLEGGVLGWFDFGVRTRGNLKAAVGRV